MSHHGAVDGGMSSEPMAGGGGIVRDVDNVQTRCGIVSKLPKSQHLCSADKDTLRREGMHTAAAWTPRRRLLPSKENQPRSGWMKDAVDLLDPID